MQKILPGKEISLTIPIIISQKGDIENIGNNSLKALALGLAVVNTHISNTLTVYIWENVLRIIVLDFFFPLHMRYQPLLETIQFLIGFWPDSVLRERSKPRLNGMCK